MQFTREIQRLLAGMLLILALIGGVAAYWATIGPDRLLARDDNPRQFEAIARIDRGDIIDRDGEVLVTTTRDEDGRAERRYLHPEMNSALGYYSLRYGVGGAEAAYDDLLRGENVERDWDVIFQEDFLHMPQRGSDVRMTLDHDVQEQVVEAMDSRRGAAAVLRASDGAVLALVSLPTYNPNSLDEQWDELIDAPGNPFFNRALQGSYQPGGTVYTVLVTTAILERVLLETAFENATGVVSTAEVELECTLEPPSNTLTLAEAYRFGCPSPFAQLADQLGMETVKETFELFGLPSTVTLPNFDNEQPTPESTPEATPESTPETGPVFQLNDALGQGEMTVTPLQMASIAASVINAGNSPQPYALMEIRPPGESEWQPIHFTRPSRAITTAETARQLQALMRENVTDGNARAAARAGYEIGGQAALALSGDETQVWFIGFVQTGPREGVAVAVVLEGSDNLDAAATIGGTALKAGAEALANENEAP